MRMISTSTRASSADASFASDVAYYLTLQPRQLPSRYLYDPLGSALFEAICRLPWYGLTRAETRLLTAHAPDVWRSAHAVDAVAELGPGSGEKLALLLAAAPARRKPREVHLVDVSASALDASRPPPERRTTLTSWRTNVITRRDCCVSLTHERPQRAP